MLLQSGAQALSDLWYCIQVQSPRQRIGKQEIVSEIVVVFFADQCACSASYEVRQVDFPSCDFPKL